VTRRQVLNRAREMLAEANIEDAPLESELLLRHILEISQVKLYQDPEGEIKPSQEEKFWALVKRRLSGEPSAYITGHRELYGLDFYVDSRVLIPRPESELLVEKALALAQTHPAAAIAEIGTGSGAIAISLSLNLPRAKIYATDISEAALKVALSNCQRHGVADRVHLLQGDMLEPLPEAVDIIVANLPYVSQAELCRLSDFEPELALDGGTDGLAQIEKLCRQASGKLHPQGFLLLEIGQGQEKAVTALLRRLFPSAGIEIVPDLSNIVRVVILSPTAPPPSI
jgi:release factor glutamine methyltransferase